jgi:GLPGLI family protein
MKTDLKHLCIVLVMGSAASLSAQDITLIEPALMECEYQARVVTDTLDRDHSFKSDYMRLRIGRTASVYYSRRQYVSDSLLYYNPQESWEAFKRDSHNGISYPCGILKERVVKNYPVGKVTVTNSFSLMDWKYEEDWEKPEWEFVGSAKVVLEHTCQLAVSRYRGRTWYAWFTADIPVSDGPWKLCGLPGLILEAYDESRDYSYTAVSLTGSHLPAVGIYDFKEKDYGHTDRIKHLRARFKELHTDQSARMSQIFDFLPSTTAITNIPGRNYEFEETDYH